MPGIVDDKLILTAGDRLRLPQATLTMDDGTPLNLAGATVAFRMVDVHTGDVIVNSMPAVKQQNDSDPDTWGQVIYVWNAGETATAGLYQAWFIITNGGPRNSTTLISILVYNYAFKSNQMGMASALAWIMFVIVCILTIIAFTSQKKWVYYSDER